MFAISAIVPTCNRSLLLERALRSIAVQKPRPLEVIVVNDAGDNDILRQNVEQPGLSTVRLVANAHAKGVSGARNTGAELAAGELLAFLDDDDEWLPSYLCEALRQFERDSLDVLAGDLLCQFDDGIDRPAKTAPDKLLPEIFLTRNPGWGGSNIILRRLLYQDLGGFNESLPTAEDRDLGLRLSLRGDVRYGRLPQRLVRFHQHNGPKLCTPRTETMSAGIRRFYELHSHRMTAQQRDEFRANVRFFWAMDEYGNNLDSDPRNNAEPLVRSLKTWLDRQRRGLVK